MIDVTPKTRRTGGLFDTAVFFLVAAVGNILAIFCQTPTSKSLFALHVSV